MSEPTVGEPRVPLLEVDPDLARHLTPEDAGQARTALTLPVVDVAPGRLRLSARPLSR